MTREKLTVNSMIEKMMSEEIDGESTINSMHITFKNGNIAYVVEIEQHGIKSKIIMQGDIVDE